MIAAVVVIGGLAAAAHADRGWAPPARAAVGPVDVSAGSFAGAVGWTHAACEGAVLWLPGIRQRWLFHVPGRCPETSTGRGVSAVAVTDQRIAFLSFVGGNTREWRLWTATPTAKRPRLLRMASADADAASPILLGNGGEAGIPYAVGRDVFVVAGDGHRAATWHAPADIVSLNVHSGTLAATLADGTVQTVLVRPSSSAGVSYTQPGARAAEDRGDLVRGHDRLGLDRPAVDRPDQVGPHLARGLVPVDRVLRHRLEHDRVQLRRHVRVERGRRRRVLPHVLVRDRHRRVPGERR